MSITPRMTPGLALLAASLVICGCTSPPLYQPRVELPTGGQRSYPWVPVKPGEHQPEAGDAEGGDASENGASGTAGEDNGDETSEAPPATARASLAYSVESAVRQALRNDPNIKVSGLDIEVSRGAVISAEGVFDPIVAGSVNRFKRRDPFFSLNPFSGLPTGLNVASSDGADYLVELQKTFDTGTAVTLRYDDHRRRTENQFALNPEYTPTYTVEISQPLLRGFGQAVQNAPVDIARHQQAASRWAFRTAASDLVLTVIQAYWEYVFALGDLEAKRAAVRTSANLVRINKELLALRKRIELDVLIAESDLASKEEAVIVAKNNVADRRDDLLALVNPEMSGLGWSVELLALDGPADAADIAIPAMAAARELAFEQRPELKELDERLRAGSLEIFQAEDALLPQLDLTGTFEWLGLGGDPDEAYDVLGDGQTYAFAAGVMVTFPIPNRTAQGSVLQAEARQEQLRLQRQDLIRVIAKDVRSSARGMGAAEERIVATAAAVKSARRSLDAAIDKQRFGRATNQDVLEASEDLTNAEISNLRARIDLVLAWAQLERAKGTLLERFGVQVRDDYPGE